MMSANLALIICAVRLTVPQIAAIAVLALIVLGAFIAFRFNTSLQMRVSFNMDDESELYNREGLEVYYNKNLKNIKKVSFVVVEIPNLMFAYKNHPKKDEYIIKIANAVLKGMKDQETAARIAFNKFAALLDDRDTAQIKEFCKKTEDILNADGFDGYSDMKFIVKFGVYENPELKDFQGDVRLTEAAIMYSSVVEKNIYYYNSEVNSYAELEAVINKARKIAVEQKQFVPYVIPRVSVKDKKVIGGEIACRWVDSTQKELYYPHEYLPIFEADGFIKQIDKLMFEAACLLAQSLSNKKIDDMVIAVNVSKKNFEDVNYADSLVEIARGFNIKNQDLEIGLTGISEEDTTEMISKFVSDLKQRGFRVASNGFGKSAQPLSAIISTSYDTYKLDSTFFATGLNTDKSKSAVVDLMNLISRQEANVVCDGVTDANTMNFVASVDENSFIQGDVISKAIPVYQFDTLLTTKYEFQKISVPKASYAPVADTSATNEEIEAQNARIAELEQMLADERAKHEEDSAKLEEESAKLEEESARLEEERAKLEEEKAKRQEHKAKLEEERAMLEEEKARTKKAAEQSARENELDRLRKELEDMRYDRSRPSNVVDRSSSIEYELDRLRRELDVEREKSKNAELKMRDNAIEQLRKEMEALKKEAEDAKKSKKYVASDEEDEDEEDLRPIAKKQKAQPKVEYDDDDDDDYEDDEIDDYDLDEDSDEEEEQLSKLMAMFKKQFRGEWEEEMMKKYPNLMKKHNERQSFADRIVKLAPEAKELFNSAKNTIMAYDGVVNVTKNHCDSFVYNRKVIAKIAISGKSVKVYLPLDPNAYSNAQFPHKDASMKKAHAKTPFAMRITSKLSAKRLGILFEDVARTYGLKVNPAFKTKDYARGMQFKRKKQ